MSTTGISFLDSQQPCSRPTLLPNQSSTGTMKKGRRPPPLNLNIVVRPRSLPRVSRTPILFAKEMVSLLTPLPEEEFDDPPDPAVRAVRIAIDFMHVVACLLVLVVLTLFLVSYPGAVSSVYSLKSLPLITALACDVGLGMWSIRFFDRPWAGWAVLLRTLTASLHLGSLIGLVAAGRVFPADYTYWGLSPSRAGGPVLALVCAILTWDLVHVLLSHRIVGCWSRLRCWWQRMRMQRRCMTARARGRERIKSGLAGVRRTGTTTRRGWSCVS